MFNWITATKPTAKESNPMLSADLSGVSNGQRAVYVQRNSGSKTGSSKGVVTGARGFSLLGTPLFSAHAMRAEMLSL